VAKELVPGDGESSNFESKGDGSIDVLLVGDIRIYREMLTKALEQQAGIRILDSVAHLEDALTSAELLLPDVILLDMTMVNSIATARAILRSAPTAKLLALHVPETDDRAIACIEAHADGYLARSASLDELITGLETVARGEVSCSPQIAAAILKRINAASDAGLSRRLTPREREALVLIEKGLSNKQIAQRMSIEIGTVKKHVHAILDKLGVARRTEAAAMARASFVTSSPVDGIGLRGCIDPVSSCISLFAIWIQGCGSPVPPNWIF
jgi:two-component system, NarL family, nitrate/nitrite response regulator NarL